MDRPGEGMNDVRLSDCKRRVVLVFQWDSYRLFCLAVRNSPQSLVEAVRKELAAPYLSQKPIAEASISGITSVTDHLSPPIQSPARLGSDCRRQQCGSLWWKSTRWHLKGCCRRLLLSSGEKNLGRLGKYCTRYRPRSHSRAEA